MPYLDPGYLEQYTGKNLFFIFSQPRAGSTLLQKMLSANKEIHTVGEPWILLNGIYNLKKNGLKAEYSHKLAYIAQKEFINSLPNAKKDYIRSLRLMYGHLYKQALFKSSKTIFLDKTPRYYFIIPEIYNLFPDAKYIFLFRNPAAVMSSFLNTWVKLPILRIKGFEKDLLTAPQMLVSGLKIAEKKPICIKYETLVKNPEKTLQQLCDFLGVVYEPKMVRYGTQGRGSKWVMGDQEQVYKRTEPDISSLDKWEYSLKTPQKWRFIRDYIEKLGPELLEEMGYSYNILKKKIENNTPHPVQRIFTISLNTAVSKTAGIVYASLSLMKLSLRSFYNRKTKKCVRE